MKSGAWERHAGRGRDWWAERSLRGRSRSQGCARRNGAAPPLPGWTPLTSVASLPAGSALASRCLPSTVWTAREHPGVCGPPSKQELCSRVPGSAWSPPARWLQRELNLSSGGLSQGERRKRCSGKTRKVMFQCQKRTLFYLTLAGAEPLPPTQFPLLTRSSPSQPSPTKGGKTPYVSSML